MSKALITPMQQVILDLVAELQDQATPHRIAEVLSERNGKRYMPRDVDRTLTSMELKGLIVSRGITRMVA